MRVTRVDLSTNETVVFELTQEEVDKLPKSADVVEIDPLMIGHELPEGSTYAERRMASYLPLDQQLDMMYWDTVNGTSNWASHVASVKAEYPKQG